MAKVNQFERQARISVALAVASAVLAVGGVVLAIPNFRFDTMEFLYTGGGKRLLVVLGMLGIGWVAGVVGCYLGFISAGHKRNSLSNTSWLGFFVNAATTTLATSAAIVVFLLRTRV